MLTRLLHRVAGIPWVYEVSQRLAGGGPIDALLAIACGELDGGSLVLDVGGGNGRLRRRIPAACHYILLDTDPAMLRAAPREDGPVNPVLGDATRLPLLDRTVDCVLCKQVSHHIPDDRLDELFREARRVLKPDGKLLFVDAVWRPDSFISRKLWEYDRGSHPRTEAEIRAALERQFQVLRVQSRINNHRYVLFELRPAAG